MRITEKYRSAWKRAGTAGDQRGHLTRAALAVVPTLLCVIIAAALAGVSVAVPEPAKSTCGVGALVV